MKKLKEVWHVVLNIFNNLKAWFVSIELHNTSLNIQTLVIINEALMDGIEHSGSDHTKQAVQRIAQSRGIEPALHYMLVQKGFSAGFVRRTKL